MMACPSFDSSQYSKECPMSSMVSKSLLPISELPLIAPIKQGFMESSDTQTYVSRLRASLRPRVCLPTRLSGFTRFTRFVVFDGGQLLLTVKFARPWHRISACCGATSGRCLI